MTVICGYHAIEELIRSGETRGTLEYSDKGPRVKAIIDAAQKAGIACAKVERADLLKRFPEARGVVFLLAGEGAKAPRGLEECLDALEDKKDALVLMLDHISDPHNFGAVLRSADQFGADLVILPNARSVKETETVLRSSAGAAAHIEQAVVPNLARAVATLKERGYWICAADMEGELLWDVDFSGKNCLIMGSEGKGVGRLLSDLADRVVSIPSQGKVDSLNVSVATGVFLYEIAKQRFSRQKP
jgi:23S rRNA (guanosine2251-2'-O)-methyltransferase